METLVFLFSFSALGVLYAMNTTPEFQEPYVILETGVAVLVIVFLFYYLITRGNPPKDFLFFVFAEFCFTCVIDLTSALEYDGIISGFMDFYQKTGEPYLGTSYAIMMCYWDGIAHFILYLMMISRITDRRAYRTLGLFWAGSLCANMSVFITGIVAGKYGSEVRPAFWLNFLFLLMPVLGAVTLFTRPKDRPLIGGYNAQHVQTMKLIWRPLDLILVVLLLAAMAFTVLRGLVALDSPLEACSVYLSQYEPYLKDPVGYPKVMAFFIGFTLSMLETRPDPICWLSWHLNTRPFFIIKAQMKKGPKANASLSLFHLLKMDNRLYSDWQLVPFRACFSSSDPSLIWVLFVLFSERCFVNRLSKDIAAAAVRAQLQSLIKPHGGDLIS
ncbi:transmembrane 6 superfamily member 2-like isoform X1 [Poecilia latipinna]|uniref:transmembrane 6 superfamily member 2-like n=1 Tax=Poecilia formosa TaxID=48698 RepID=UPI00072E9D14|nr:PREDICTED: transmembrane 6 superfamily member 2-like [Poecilia formosa]XP_014890295.1 PREDICTED: transmembrane 6 superfamily member 2 isoform X1 [Poecilia latipinna]XP_014891555.1 PREDICTED: transmembrane 6 superfamily member 2-like isoform X1 [Poecilia latipinna]XP_016536182.1 PREDICTED: transmembrane 6 superfamily member 2 isoform X1 [Poecilia formosa]